MHTHLLYIHNLSCSPEREVEMAQMGFIIDINLFPICRLHESFIASLRSAT